MLVLSSCFFHHPGVFKAIHITSFSFNQPMSKSEEQYLWLEQELKKVSLGMLALCLAPDVLRTVLIIILQR
jgi:hypothetical protein